MHAMLVSTSACSEYSEVLHVGGHGGKHKQSIHCLPNIFWLGSTAVGHTLQVLSVLSIFLSMHALVVSLNERCKTRI